ncbi:MAG: putative tricarboxylic transport rane protein [Clostridiales bacterium]|nr:putative tricarboxylic transport rane protein [Clostridiales bacterium]MDK2933743.1 putative tricarboxylic transport rane protein [Clostridiales bacterium]
MEWLDILSNVLHPSVSVYLVIGVLVGVGIGTLPGLTATMAVAILTPLTFWLQPEQGFAMLIGVYNSAIFAGGISAILINTPGTPASIATSFDGFAMTRKGEVGLALGINTIYSVIGGLFSSFVLIIAAFPLARFALKFGPAEYFALAIFGLSMMISVSEKSILKGLLIGTLGLLISTIGLDPMLSSPRYTFGNIHLMEGISFIPVMIGLFGVGEVLHQIFENDQKVRSIMADNTIGRIFPTLGEVKRLLPSTALSSVISVVTGAIPGAGGDIASIICWDQAKRMSKKPEEFGEGSIEGLANTCLANNGVIGGAMTTMLTLGIPGDAVTAVLIGSLMMYGMQPGPRLFVEHADFVKRFMLLMVLANIVILFVGLLGAKLSVKILKVKKEIIWMLVLLLCVIGSYALNSSFVDVVVMSVAGILGFFFRKMEFPLGPFILGMLLGRLGESNLRRALALSQGSYSIFITKPITIILLIAAILSIVIPLIKEFNKKKTVQIH